MTPQAHLHAKGWVVFDPDPSVMPWVAAAHRAGQAVLADPDMRTQWLQCEGTWFVGVNALPNLSDGSIDGVPLRGPAIDFLGGLPALHRAQLSVTWPGYPRPRAGESASSFRYREKRDAAHVDGLLPIGPKRARMLREPHAWILGLPLTQCDPGASPLVVYSGSHHIMHDAFHDALKDLEEADRGEADLTETYVTARRAVFATCQREVLMPQPGAAILMHRHCLHGIAPWTPGAKAPPEGRQIAYFRPQLANAKDWIARMDLPTNS